MATGNEYFADEIGTLKLNQVPTSDFCRDVGYLISGINKEVKVIHLTMQNILLLIYYWF
jgi:GTP-binding protein LepA